MRKVFILERIEYVKDNRPCWILTLPRNHWIERTVMRFTSWRVECARLGTDIENYSMIYINRK